MYTQQRKSWRSPKSHYTPNIINVLIQYGVWLLALNRTTNPLTYFFKLWFIRTKTWEEEVCDDTNVSVLWVLSVIMALISPGEERRVPNIKMPWIIPLCLLCFTPVICGTSFQQFRVGTYTYFGGGGGVGVGWSHPLSHVFNIWLCSFNLYSRNNP